MGKCSCFDEEDKKRILNVIEQHPGGTSGFNQNIRKLWRQVLLAQNDPTLTSNLSRVSSMIEAVSMSDTSSILVPSTPSATARSGDGREGEGCLELKKAANPINDSCLVSVDPCASLSASSSHVRKDPSPIFMHPHNPAASAS